MTQDETIELARQAGIVVTGNAVLKLCQLVEAKKQDDIETLYALYEQACKQRNEVMAQQREMMLKLREANEVIFKSCVNLAHWKRTAMRYLKRNVPQAHQQAVDEFNEHPDGRGQA
jgi:recombinational DNA repair ATPase RecF